MHFGNAHDIFKMFFQGGDPFASDGDDPFGCNCALHLVVPSKKCLENSLCKLYLEHKE